MDLNIMNFQELPFCLRQLLPLGCLRKVTLIRFSGACDGLCFLYPVITARSQPLKSMLDPLETGSPPTQITRAIYK